ncbi:MAG: tripartite tricarboxylate transporter permease [Gemmatimonadota bacterium]|nr:tripartite tricarboxylate transporter permease [Gemmatimonadota bacterium]
MTPELLLAPELLPFLVGGVLLGIVVGAVPGLTATLAISLLLPLTYQLAPLPAIVMMTGIFTGGIYGGSIAAITLRIPGAPASAMTMLDGYAMAQRGKAGSAIALATFSSFVGGIFGGVVLVLFAPQLARVALTFQSPEMFALVVLALIAVATVSRESLPKSMTATVIGLMLATVGIDRLVPVPRYTFASVDLLVGVPLIPVVIGLFAVTELLHQSGESGEAVRPSEAQPGLGAGRLAALWSDARSVRIGVWVKSPIIGTLVGALPGAGAAMAAFLSYSEAKRSSAEPERFGSGVPEGIVAPEAANNAMTGGAFIPMLALGIPGDAVTAVILGGLVVHGITPGPQLFGEASELLAPLFGAYFWSYVLILVFGLALIPVFVRITRVPRGILFPVIGSLAIVAAFTSEGTTFAMCLTAGVGVLGFVLRRYGYPLIPVLLGLILGPMLESNLRRSLILSQGDATVFLRSPIAAGLLLAAAAFPLLMLRRRRIDS